MLSILMSALVLLAGLVYLAYVAYQFVLVRRQQAAGQTVPSAVLRPLLVQAIYGLLVTIGGAIGLKCAIARRRQAIAQAKK